METDTREMLLQQVLCVVDAMENPPLCGDDGQELEGAHIGEDCYGDEHVVTDGIVLKDGTNWGASYIPENDAGEIGYRGETYYTDDWIWTVEGHLILGGVRHPDARPMSGYDYLADVLDIEYTIAGHDRSFLGADVLVTFGGPNVRIDTRRDTVIGAWGGDVIERSYFDNVGLHEAAEDLFNCH